MLNIRKRSSGNADEEDPIPNDIKKQKIVFTRTYEHVEGNWPGFICIPLSKSPELTEVSTRALKNFESNRQMRTFSALEQLQAYADSEEESDTFESSSSMTRATDRCYILEENPHISLCRPFALRSHQIQPFVDRLGLEIAQALGFIKQNKYHVDLSSAAYRLVNDTGTRGFVCLPVDRDYSEILPSLVTAVDAALKSFQKPSYYTNPQFHVSVASFIVDQTEKDAIVLNQPLHGADDVSVPRDLQKCATLIDSDKASNAKIDAGIFPSNLLITSQQLLYVRCTFGNREFRLALGDVALAKRAASASLFQEISE